MVNGHVLERLHLLVLGQRLGAVDHHQRVARSHALSFLNQKTVDPSGQFAGDPYFGRLDLSLQYDGLRSSRIIPITETIVTATSTMTNEKARDFFVLSIIARFV